jgi:hypothetical protein
MAIYEVRVWNGPSNTYNASELEIEAESVSFGELGMDLSDAEGKTVMYVPADRLIFVAKVDAKKKG